MLLHGRRAAAPRPAAARPALLRRACAVAVAAVIPVLAGCEAGLNAPVLQWHPPTNGASATIPAAGGTGEIALRNVFVLGAPPASTLPAGGSAGVFLALVNTGPRDRLVRVTAPGTARSVTLPGGAVTLPRTQTELLTGPEPKIILSGLIHSLASGGAIRLVFTFQNAGSKALYVPVLSKSQYYVTYSAVPSPSSTVTPTVTPSRKHRGKHATATASPGATPTATATP